jgi:hypothetical protein
MTIPRIIATLGLSPSSTQLTDSALYLALTLLNGQSSPPTTTATILAALQSAAGVNIHQSNASPNFREILASLQSLVDAGK